jgi:hypothetical protein
MKRGLLLLALICLNLSVMAQEGKSASWIWYPGDFELWLASRLQVERTERGMFYPPFWRMDRHTPLVAFSKSYETTEDETLEICVDGRYYMQLDWQFIYNAGATFTAPKGKHSLRFLVYNTETPPSVFVRGKTIVTDGTWKADRQDNNPVAADRWTFDAPDTPPSSYRLAVTPQYPVMTAQKNGGVIVDFGKETFGYIRIHGLQGKGAVIARYGESEAEALAGEQAETWDVFEIDQPTKGDFTASASRALRYVLVTATGGVTFDSVSLLYEYLPLEYRGSFRCSDDEINHIWDVSAYTLHLSSREFFLDGIKRDRWLWSGDASQSYLMNYYLFFDSPLVKRTLRALRGGDPVATHINTILDYSFYWFVSIYDYYLYTGDKEFLRQIYPKMKTLMDFCLGRRNRDGFVEGMPGDWVFVDWAPIDKEGELSVEQLLFCRSLEAMALCAGLMNDSANETRYAQTAAELKRRILEVFWDEERKALVHSRKNGKPDTTVTRYANMFAMSFGYFDEAQQEAVKTHVLLNDSVQKITTPYMRFYELEALCRIGQQRHVLQEIKDYWGGMLRLGATSFWEAYDPTESGLQHYAMYGRPFGKSLCHAWGASPLYLLGKYWLGVTPAAPGYERYIVEPELGGLKWMKGEVPTPNGNIRVEMSEKEIVVETATGGVGVLRFNSVRKPSCKTAAVRKIADGTYELDLQPSERYEVVFGYR